MVLRVFQLVALVLVALSARPRVASATTMIAGGNVGNQIWMAADGPFIIQGNITVEAGATLTIQSGTVVKFASANVTSGAPKLELIVDGALAVNGTTSEPVTFEGQAGTAPGTWQGITISASAASARISDAIIRHATRGVASWMTATPLVVEKTTIEINSATGISVIAGIARLDALRMRNNPVAIELDSTVGDFTVTNSILTGNGTGLGASFPSAAVNREIVNCTIDGNSTVGISVLAGAAGAQGLLNVHNSIVTNNNTGIARVQASVVVNVTYSDVWNNLGADFSGGIVAGTGSISANPQFASATDWHLSATSVCIDSGGPTSATGHDLEIVSRPQDGNGIADTDGSEYDMGAYEFLPSSGAGGASGGSGGLGGVGGGTGGLGGGNGTGGRGGAAGTGGAGGAANLDSSVDGTNDAGLAKSGGGCGCHTVGADTSPGAVAIITLGLALTIIRRRRPSALRHQAQPAGINQCGRGESNKTFVS